MPFSRLRRLTCCQSMGSIAIPHSPYRSLPRARPSRASAHGRASSARVLGLSRTVYRARHTSCMAPRDPIAEIRRICLALPEVVERPSHGAPTFFVRGKKSFATFWNDHHGDGRVALICAAPPGVQRQLVDEEPERFYVPAYVGHRGWIGVRIDVAVDWDEIEAIVHDAYRCVAPVTLVRQLDGT